MISPKVAEMLNQQITEEFYAAYLYLSMAAQAEEMNLKGYAKWLYTQSAEEQTHAMKIFHYLVEQGQKVTLKPINQPKTTWNSPLEMAKDGLAHEKLVTSTFNKMMDVAHAEKDYASIAFMNWYVSEQVEEESNANDVINMFESMKECAPARMMVDRHLGKRE